MEIRLFGFQIELDRSYLENPKTEITRQLREYESGERTVFDLTVFFPDTFFGNVWRTISTIDYGQTCTYADVATELGTSPIAVGNANANNPLPIIIPCHRIVGVNSLRGFRYPGMKELLLRHENQANLEQLGLELDGSV